VVRRIAADHSALGAVITTHKLALFQACRDLFAGVDRDAALCREVTAISREREQILGHATDPLAAAGTLRAMLGPNYRAERRAGVLCLGAGGAATAIAVSLLGEPGAGDAPEPFIAVDTRPERLDALRAVIQSANPKRKIVTHCHADAGLNDALLATLAPGSLVINATGMGKDRPGSPVTDARNFPERAVVWDLNYRGPLHFLRQARAQADNRRLQVHDGWLFFLHGWAHALSPILHQDLAGEYFAELSSIANAERSHQ
jgi:shikimate 5-dehydrogenase